MKHLQLFESFTPISENLKYHIDNNIPVLENVFRPHSEAFYNLIKEARELFDGGKIGVCNLDQELFETTDLGHFGVYEGQIVPLDLPIENIEEINEAEYKGREVELNKPTRSSGPKKYKVYVKNPKTGRVKVVNFGDVKGGLSAKVSDPKARARFSARMNCPAKKDKTKAGYWACRANRYSTLWGGRTYPGFW
jgi:hypothetical protein